VPVGGGGGGSGGALAGPAKGLGPDTRRKGGKKAGGAGKGTEDPGG